MSTTHYIPDAGGWASQAASWGTSAAGRGHLRLVCERSYDRAANASTLRFTAWVYSEYYEGNFSASGSILVGGNSLVSFDTQHKVNVFRDSTWRQLTKAGGPNAWTVTLPHDGSGKLSAPVALDLTMTYTVGGVTYVMKWSDSAAFTVTEPRGSAISAIPASVSTLENLNVTVTRASTAHRHRASVMLGDTLLYSSPPFGASVSIPVPRSWLQSRPDTASIACTVSVQTYTDSSCQTALGDPATASVTVKADAGMRPVLQSGYASAVPYNTGFAARIPYFISGKSRAELSFDPGKLDMSATAGASVVSVTAVCGGMAATGTPLRTAVLRGTAEIRVTVTDSRGRSATQTLTVNTMPYASPTLSQVRVFRCDSGGAADEGGNYISVSAVGGVSSLQGQNVLTLTAAWAQGSGSFGTENALQSGIARVLGGSLDPDQKLRVRVRAKDTLTDFTETTVTLPPRTWAMKFRPDGMGVGFGMAPTEANVLQLPAGWKIKIGDTIVAQGYDPDASA